MSELIQYEYPRPCITADILVSYKKNICLVERRNDPYKGILALPGGYFDVEKDFSIHECAVRELWEETHIEPMSHLFGYLICKDKTQLKFKKWYDRKGRDPRARTITFVYRLKITREQFLSAEAGDDATKLYWVPKNKLGRLAFDHYWIIKECW